MPLDPAPSFSLAPPEVSKSLSAYPLSDQSAKPAVTCVGAPQPQKSADSVEKVGHGLRIIKVRFRYWSLFFVGVSGLRFRVAACKKGVFTI